MSRSVLTRIFLLVVLALCAGSIVKAQTGTSSIGGTVTDQQGKAVPNAKVTLINVATNATRTTEASESGAYLFDLITPGDYRIEVEAAGFRKTVIGKVQALIGRRIETNVELSVGGVAQVVEVTAGRESALMNTQDASLGNVLESNQITQLPLEGRNLVDLLSLQPVRRAKDT